jgi:hypothetical protein
LSFFDFRKQQLSLRSLGLSRRLVDAPRSSPRDAPESLWTWFVRACGRGHRASPCSVPGVHASAIAEGLQIIWDYMQDRGPLAARFTETHNPNAFLTAVAPLFGLTIEK